jgi:thiol-disulfide isomerase/thioredoxin
MRYVTGDNAPGYLPETEPRGPWNSWEDACRDVASMIEQAAEDVAENPDADASYIESQKAAALIDVDAYREHETPAGLDFIFLGRAYFIRPAEAGE